MIIAILLDCDELPLVFWMLHSCKVRHSWGRSAGSRVDRWVLLFAFSPTLEPCSFAGKLDLFRGR